MLKALKTNSKVSDNLKTGHKPKIENHWVEAWSQSPCCCNMSRSCFSHANILQKIKKVFDRFPSSMLDLLVARGGNSGGAQSCLILLSPNLPTWPKRCNHNEAFIAISWGFHLRFRFVRSPWKLCKVKNGYNCLNLHVTKWSAFNTNSYLFFVIL